MVSEQLIRRGISEEKVLAAFRKIEREKFVPEILRRESYYDGPLSIGEGQTISQPYIVAYMLEALGLKGDEKVLEIGTGSGYQTALLSLLVKKVYSIERSLTLAKRAQNLLSVLDLKNVEIILGDGTKGVPEFMPYDAIIVSAAAPKVPPALLGQLADAGRMIIPIGEFYSQVLVYFKKEKNEIREKKLESCVFVPLIGEYGWKDTKGDVG